jgi:hypothetical protein
MTSCSTNKMVISVLFISTRASLNRSMTWPLRLSADYGHAAYRRLAGEPQTGATHHQLGDLGSNIRKRESQEISEYRPEAASTVLVINGSVSKARS